MLPWPVSDDDFQVMESEQVSESRTQEEKEAARLQWEAMDALDIEDQNVLEQRFQEALTQDPMAQLQWACSEETFAFSERLEQEAQRLMPGSRPQSRGHIILLNSPFITTDGESTKPKQLKQREKSEQLPPSSMPKQPQSPMQTPPLTALKRDEKKITPYDVAQMLLHNEILLVQNNLVRFYNEGIYRAMTKEDVQRLVIKKCREAVAKVGISKFLKDTFDFVFLEPRIYADEIDPSPDIVVFRDGVLDLQRNKIIPHSPEIFATRLVKANIAKGIQEACPTFDSFVQTASQGDPFLESRILEAIGYILSQDHRGKCFFVIQGPTNSGKSVFERLLKSFFEKNDISALQIRELGKNFANSDLIGKSLWIDPELPDKSIDSNAVAELKKLTGRDPISANIKYMPRATFANDAKIVLISNHPVWAETSDEAFLARMIAIPFSHSIPKCEQDPDLDKKLSVERDAIAAKAMRYLRRLQDNGYVFSGAYSVNDMALNGDSLPHMVHEFCRESCESANGIWTPTYEFFSAFAEKYGNICEINTFSGYFWAIVQDVFPDAEKKRSRVNGHGNPIGGYKGIGLRPNECFIQC